VRLAEVLAFAFGWLPGGRVEHHRDEVTVDVERQVPVLVTFKNAEINPRRGVFTLAVNRMRSLGLKPTQCAFRLTFTPGDGPYSVVQIEVTPVTEILPADKLEQITQTLDNCWAPYRAAQLADAAELEASL
jgi:hypothetical protein